MLADQLALDLPMSTAAPALARSAVERLDLGPAACETARLLASELVSNALRHSGAGAAAPIHLWARVSDGALRMSVTDAGAGFAPPGEPVQRGAGGGFGLFLVDRLADAWGVETTDGTTVWLEITLDPS